MSVYSKISTAISIEVAILAIINIIIKFFIYPTFDSWYVIIAQFSLLIIQLIIMILQSKEYKKEFEEIYKCIKK